jgi:hypothetical protein
MHEEANFFREDRNFYKCLNDKVGLGGAIALKSLSLFI